MLSTVRGTVAACERDTFCTPAARENHTLDSQEKKRRPHSLTAGRCPQPLRAHARDHVADVPDAYMFCSTTRPRCGQAVERTEGR